MKETQNLTNRLQKNLESEGTEYLSIPMLHLTYNLCSASYENTIDLIDDAKLINKIYTQLENGNVRFLFIYWILIFKEF